jgi:cell pole-organizing protein PopZ
MAQIGGAQREPSMEEILASIRRIIEDSDTGRKPSDDAESPRPANDAGNMESGLIEVDAFRAELRAIPAIRETAKSVTSADVQGHLPAAVTEQATAPKYGRRASDGVAASTQPVAEPEWPVVTPPGSEQSAPPKYDRSTAGVADASTQAVAGPERAVVSTPASEPIKNAFMGKMAESPAEPPSAWSDDDLDVSLDEIDITPAEELETATIASPSAAATGFAKPAILSEHAGRQVAAAFGELSEAFAASRKKSFDELAEEMMRPMLQDWLDNNLPQLVERLVREEIERVARGVQ